ncbi:MAG: YvcK family protein [Nitriliruptoraceae bacterium]|nr:YvcK family protein [Nitriliruptoraceae bacterium]
MSASGSAVDPPSSAAIGAAVALGGGHGLARSLRACTRLAEHTTAVVTVADDGGSSGRLRRDLDVLPPGDLRMALTAMARRHDVAEVIGYRFHRGELAGHSLGNLVLIAMQDLAAGDLVTALDRLCALLACPGRVLPCTETPVTLRARTAEGAVTGQVAVAATPRLQQVWLDPDDPLVTPGVVDALAEAELIVLGPGSLYTSLIPNLLVPGVTAGLAASSAPIVYVANLREQPGETEGMGLVDHLDALTAHVPGLQLDAVLAHGGDSPSGQGAPLPVDATAVGRRMTQLIVADLLDGADGHDPAKLAHALTALVSP